MPAYSGWPYLVVVMDVAQVLAGSAAARVAAAAVALSVAGAANGSVMSGGRFLYATARDGQAPVALAAVGVTSRAPHAALWAQAVWACALLTVPGVNFGTLLGYFGAASWLFYALTAASVVGPGRHYPPRHRHAC
jgi:amino acid transporter